MDAALQNLKILWPVIVALAIAVVYFLVCRERAPENGLSHEDVLEDAPYSPSRPWMFRCPLEQIAR